MSGPDEGAAAVTPEERLRKLLNEAVEPVQPGPGAQARLEAKIRSGARRERDLPKRLRWSAAILGAAAVVAGVVVIGIQPHGDGDSKSSAASGASAPSAAASESAPRAPRAIPAPTSPASQAGSGTAGTTEGTAGGIAGAPDSRKAASPASGEQLGPLLQPGIPSDLDGDHVADLLRLSGDRFVVQFAKGSQSVALPGVGSGARVLGITQLLNAQNGATAVAFVRLRTDSVHAYDTAVALVAGKLTVLQLAGKPVVLTVSGVQGYTCGGPLIVTAGQDVSYVVKGADLVANGSTLAGRPGANCTFS